MGRRKQAASPPPHQNFVLGGGALLVVLFGLYYVLTKDGGGLPPDRPRPEPPAAAKEPDAIDAWVMAKTFVKRGLKSPATADFGSALGEHQRSSDACSLGDAGGWRCAGWVDSQNSFGATLRNRWELTMVYVGGPEGTWRLTSGPTFSDW